MQHDAVLWHSLEDGTAAMYVDSSTPPVATTVQVHIVGGSCGCVARLITVTIFFTSFKSFYFLDPNLGLNHVIKRLVSVLTT